MQIEQKFLRWYQDKMISKTELSLWSRVSVELLSAFHGKGNRYCLSVVERFWNDYRLQERKAVEK